MGPKSLLDSFVIHARNSWKTECIFPRVHFLCPQKQNQSWNCCGQPREFSQPVTDILKGMLLSPILLLVFYPSHVHSKINNYNNYLHFSHYFLPSSSVTSTWQSLTPEFLTATEIWVHSGSNEGQTFLPPHRRYNQSYLQGPWNQATCHQRWWSNW